MFITSPSSSGSSSETLEGSSTPNGSVTADPGTIYRQTDGLLGVSRWVKVEGTDDQGWVIETATPTLTGVTAGNLSQWGAALTRAKNGDGVAKVIWLGTSNVYGLGASDIENNGAPFALANMLNATVAPAVKYMEPTNHLSVPDIANARSYMSISGSGASTETVTMIADHGLVRLNSGSDGTFTYTHPDCEYFTLLVRDWANSFDVKVDGGSAVTKNGADTGPCIEYTIDCRTRGAHTLTVDNVEGADPLKIAAVGGGIDSGVLVSNYGVSGSHSADWVKDGTLDYGSRSSTFAAHQPDLVIITLGGGNDINEGISAASYETNLDTLIAHIQANTDADVILQGPTWWRSSTPGDLDAFHEAALSAAQTAGVPYQDVVKSLGGDPEKYLSRGHLNENAHQIWAFETFKAITAGVRA